MLIHEFKKLTPNERDIILWWRFANYPDPMFAEEIAKHTEYNLKFIQQTIKKLSSEIRLKIELNRLKKDIIDAFAKESQNNDT